MMQRLFNEILAPLAGLFGFWLLVSPMRSASIPSPPIVPYFLLFATLGGWVLVLLTAYFWQWSGMASLGLFYLIFVAPFLTGALAWRLRYQHAFSGFHRFAFIGFIAYSCLILGLLVWATSTGQRRDLSKDNDLQGRKLKWSGGFSK